MPGKRARNAGLGKAHLKEQLSRDMRWNKVALFLQQFDKEVQERLNDIHGRRENLLATADRAYEVELMKIPPSLRKTRIGDLISDEAIPASDVSMVIQNESPKQQQPLRRMHSKRAKLSDSSPAQSTPPQRSSTKTSRGGKGTKRIKALVGSNSTGNLRGSSVSSKRTQSCLMKTNDQDVTVKPKLRSVVSAGDLHCSMAACSAHITVTTAQGQTQGDGFPSAITQTLSFSEETKDEINLDLLDDVAWCQIQKLKSLMKHLSR